MRYVSHNKFKFFSGLKKSILGILAGGLMVGAMSSGASAGLLSDFSHDSGLEYNLGFIFHAQQQHEEDKIFEQHARDGFKSVSYAPWSDNWYRACSIKYENFDPETGYVVNGNKKRFCKI